MINIHDVVPADVLTAAVARHGEVFVQGAWRRVVDGVPDGYMPQPYPKFQQHRLTGETCTVATRADHEALYASDPNWELPPGDDLLARFLAEVR